eukprot:CAMPEP_0177652118 /NCGR_PEP_ID=MMETSP0447-20121125/12934_1 /TAXON_ID=0 /ORGANISM="Stygamoeba regulata, Strain BSH-02190019" /LENGTH=455 /DNA_ID=CAMNT_0019155291 /DNA_START=169 /DNA_END=1536 /DNA_ORIENTATION=+
MAERDSSSKSEASSASSSSSVEPKVKNTGLGTSSRALGAAVIAVGSTAVYFWQLWAAVQHGSWFYSFMLLISGTTTFLLIAASLLAYYAAGIAMKPPWYKPSDPGQPLTQEGLPEYWLGICTNPLKDLNIPYEDVSFECPKGRKRKQRLVNIASKMRTRRAKEAEERDIHSHITLRGWWVPAKEGSKPQQTTIVCVHGGGRDRRAWLRHLPIFYERGYSTLLFDLREHGQSDGTGRGFSYGCVECLDVSAAVKYAKERSGLPKVAVVATSVGATASILAAADDDNICGVVAENPLTRASDLIAQVYWQGLDYALGPKISRTFVFKWLGRFIIAVFLYRIGAVSEDSLFADNRGAVDLVHRLGGRPLLLMHGTSDRIIPYSHSQRIYHHAMKPKTLWLVEGGVHCALYDQNKEEYVRHVTEFLHTVDALELDPGSPRPSRSAYSDDQYKHFGSYAE